jgi:signal transduction histidine kinase
MPLTLKTKILLIFVFVVTFSSVINIGVARFIVSNSLSTELLSRIAVHTKSMVSDVTNFVLIGDTDSIVSLIYNQRQADESLAYMMVLDDGGKLLASTLLNKDPEKYVALNPLPEQQDERIVEVRLDNGRPVYDIALRLQYNKGVVRAGYYKESVDNSVSSVFLLLVLGSLAALLVALSAALVLTRGMFSPLVSLKNVVENFAKGDFKVRATANSSDEVGSLAVSVNVMADKLQTMYTKLDSDVKDKTAELSNKVQEIEQSRSAIINLLEDIDTDKKRVEDVVLERTQELSAEKARLLASINSIPFGFLIADKSNRIVLRNKIMSDMFVLDDTKDLYLRDIAQRVGTDTNLESYVESCEKEGAVCEMKEIVLGTKVLRGIVAPVHAQEKSEVIGFVFMLEDITEAKVLERSRDEFFAVASHELRTPLTAIRGNTDMILDTYADKMTDPEVREMLSDISEASIRLIGIVNDFLDVSRLEQGTVTLENSAFDLQDVIEKVIKTEHTGAVEKKLAVTFDRAHSVPVKVFADKDKVEQILFNLVGNSVKFTASGSVTVSTETEGALVRVRVSDTGPGISALNENLLFRKFQPAGDQVLARDVTKSTGLGLYISRLLITKMGGTIGLEKSIVGEGSVFFFTLPTAP